MLRFFDHGGICIVTLFIGNYNRQVWDAVPEEDRDPALTTEVKMTDVPLEQILGWGCGARNVLTETNEMPAATLMSKYPPIQVHDLLENNEDKQKPLQKWRAPLRHDQDTPKDEIKPKIPTSEVTFVVPCPSMPSQVYRGPVNFT